MDAALAELAVLDLRDSRHASIAVAAAAALIRARWTTANAPSFVAQFLWGLALQKGHIRASGLTERISGITSFFAMRRV